MTRPSHLPGAAVLAAAAAVLAVLATGPAVAGSHGNAASMATSPSASVRLLSPADGATVASPFKVRFGVDGMAVAPAGELEQGTGHHHLLIGSGPVVAGQVVPADDRHLHFGKGQTETEVTLAPGTYRLTAQFADGAHRSYGPALSHTITVTVK
jgi:hypothetical protein